MGRQSQNCFGHSHYHEVLGSFWNTPCLRIVGSPRCRIWCARCSIDSFFPNTSSICPISTQYSRPRSSPPTSACSLCPHSPSCTFSPHTSASFSSPSSSGCSSSCTTSCTSSNCPCTGNSTFLTCSFSTDCRTCPNSSCSCSCPHSCNPI